MLALVRRVPVLLAAAVRVGRIALLLVLTLGIAAMLALLLTGDGAAWIVSLIVLGSAFLVIAGRVIVRRISWLGDDEPTLYRGPPRRIDVPGVYGAALEIDPSWPGRTRLRIPAASALPMAGAARLVPRSFRRQPTLSRGFSELVWTGRGREAATRWSERLAKPLRRLYGWRDRYTLQATLTPFGLIVHMPLVVATGAEEPFLLEQAAALADALAAIADGPAIEGVHFVAVRELAGQCPCCWEMVSLDDTDLVTCPGCGAHQHADCAAWAGGCGRFACSGIPPQLAAARQLG